MLPFQNFGDFPACVLGDLKLIIRVSPDALVWCSVDPAESVKQMAETYPFTADPTARIYDYKKAATLLGCRNIDHNYDHRFTQVNTYGRAASNVAVDNIVAGGSINFCGYKVMIYY
jgi:hypothetical protein